jgi:antitoxin ParD1/3/4
LKLGAGFMSQLQIEISDDLQQFVEERRQVHQCDNASDYFDYLLRMEVLRLEHDQVDALLLEGIASGPARPLTKQDWEDLKQRVYARLESIKTS